MTPKLLLDTHVLLSVGEGAIDGLSQPVREALALDGAKMFASVASLWEIAIKHRLGKLPLPCPIAEWPSLIRAHGVEILTVSESDVVGELDPLPPTRDPFDRLLLAICQARELKLLTVDRSLIDHPLSFTTSRA